jgi:hypothetical protein
MRTKLLATAALVMGFGSGAVAAPLFGPKGQFSTFISTLKYDPSKACTKPYRPLSGSEYAMRSYLADAERYLDCMRDASNADARYATEVVAEGYKEASAEFLQELKGGF